MPKQLKCMCLHSLWKVVSVKGAAKTEIHWNGEVLLCGLKKLPNCAVEYTVVKLRTCLSTKARKAVVITLLACPENVKQIISALDRRFRRPALLFKK